MLFAVEKDPIVMTDISHQAGRSASPDMVSLMRGHRMRRSIVFENHTIQ
jgi:hypothetical protein